MAEQRQVRELPTGKPHVRIVGDVGRRQPVIVRRRRPVVRKTGHGVDLVTLVAHRSEDRCALEFFRDEPPHRLLIAIHRPGQHRRDADDRGRKRAHVILEEREARVLAVHLGALGLEDVVEGIGLKPVEHEVEHVLLRGQLEDRLGRPFPLCARFGIGLHSGIGEQHDLQRNQNAAGKDRC